MLRGLLRSASRSEQSEASRARTGHARQQAVRRGLQRREHVGDDGLNPDRGNFQIVAPRGKDRHQRGGVRVDLEEIIRRSGRREHRRRERGEYILGRHRDAGIDQHRGQFRQRERRGQISPMPRIMRAFSSRHTGTSAPVTRAASRTRASSRERSFSRASSRNAAAASDEPPPRPAATGNSFSRLKRPSRNSSTRSASARAALSTRLSPPAPAASAVGPLTSSASVPPGASVRRSPTSANATRLSSS